MVNTVKFSDFTQVDLSNSTNEIVGVSSPSGGTDFKSPFPSSWDISTRPVSPLPGTLGYNTSLTLYEFWNGLAWVQLAAGGSGSVGISSANRMAFYPTTGNSITGLLNQNNAALVTNNLGVPSMTIATGTGTPVKSNSPIINDPTFLDPITNSIQFSSTKGIVGSTTNDNADVGSVGELVSSIINSGSSISISNNIATNLTSIILHAGDWDVWGNINFTASSVTSSCTAWVSRFSATQPDKSLYSKLNVQNNSDQIIECTLTIPMQRFSLASQTTVYLSGLTLFSVGSVSICGGIYARVRR